MPLLTWYSSRPPGTSRALNIWLGRCEHAHTWSLGAWALVSRSAHMPPCSKPSLVGVRVRVRFRVRVNIRATYDEQAYAAALTYALVYGAAEGGTPNPNEGTPNPTRREQFTVDIYTRVSAVPVARSSVRGQIPSGERCDNASRAANSTGSR